MFKPSVRIKSRLWDRLTRELPAHSVVITKFREFLRRRGSANLIHDFDIPGFGRSGRAFQATSDVRLEMIVRRARVTGRAIITIVGLHVLRDGRWVEVLPVSPSGVRAGPHEA
ncbi:MAG: hypothetical protein AB7Q17_09115 [Phycisphaerae bacterium]